MTDKTTQERDLPTDEELVRLAPPTSGRRELRVGIFVLVGIAAVLLVLFMMTDPATFRGRYELATLVENAGGIRSGDPVQMRGVNIGRVRQFNLTPEGVLIALEIEGIWDIPEDSRTRLVSNGLLGGRTVDVIQGGSPRRAPRGTVLPGELVASALESTDDFAVDVQDVLGRVQRLLSDTTVSAVQGGAVELEALLQELGRVVDSQRNELTRLTASLNRTASELEGVTSTAGPDLARTLARADSAMVQLNRTSGTLDEAASSLRTVLGRMERGEGTLGRLATDEALYTNLNRASESMAELLEDVRLNPGRYIRLRLF
jgi:phospholipid/cholesterol/gamma-HCH transport system substrate-binding protein